MLENPATRMLRLLSLLQSRRAWTGPEIVDRLGVSPRTIRRDVERLRSLGYTVESTTGTAGGYRLTPGHDLPPLLLDDAEAIAIAAALLTAADGTGTDASETSARALAKLQQILPRRLRNQVDALAGATTTVSRKGLARVDLAVLAAVAAACRDQEILTFEHERRDGTAAGRRVEPHHVVATRLRWYLISFDLDRDDWRTFRLDRVHDPVPVGHRFTARPLPLDPAAYLRSTLARTPFAYTAEVVVDAAADDVRALLPYVLPELVEPLGATRSRVRLGADAAAEVVRRIASIATFGLPFAVERADAPVRAGLSSMTAALAAAGPD